MTRSFKRYLRFRRSFLLFQKKKSSYVEHDMCQNKWHYEKKKNVRKSKSCKYTPVASMPIKEGEKFTTVRNLSNKEKKNTVNVPLPWFELKISLMGFWCKQKNHYLNPVRLCHWSIAKVQRYKNTIKNNKRIATYKFRKS